MGIDEWIINFISSHYKFIISTIIAFLFYDVFVKKIVEVNKQCRFKKKFTPLIIDGRIFIWRDRGPIDDIKLADEDKQLCDDFFKLLCDQLKKESGMEPECNLDHSDAFFTGAIVYEVSSDFKYKQRLRIKGQILVLKKNKRSHKCLQKKN